MSAIDVATDHIRKECYRRQIRLQEFCTTFQRGGVKKITQHQFRRAVDQAKVTGVTEDMFSAIFAQYGTADGLDIYHQRFCDAIDEAFTVKDLEKNPTMNVTTTYAGKSLSAIGKQLSSTEQVEADYAMDKLRAKASSEGVIFKMFFEDLDKNNDGSVTVAQFKRQIEKCAPNTLEFYEVDLLCKAYSCNGGLDVNYRAMHHRAVPEGPPGTGVVLQSSTIRKPAFKPSATAATDAVEDKIMKYTKQDRIRPVDAFKDYDLYNRGFCPRAKFLSALFTLYGNRISSTEMDQIADKYQKEDKVGYKAFCNVLEEAFVTPSLEKDPMAQSSSRAISVANAGRRASNKLSETEMVIFNAAMASLRTQVKTQRIDAKPTLQDFDKGREEHVTKEQFLRAMNKVDLLRSVSMDGWNAIFKFFAANDNRRDGSLFINYVEFVAAIEASPSTSRLGSAGSYFVSTPAPVSVRSAEEIVRDIAQKCKADKIRVSEFFFDYDPLRKRKITKQRFLRALDVAKVKPVSVAEQDALCARYRSGDNEVNYGDFNSDVERVVTVRGLEANPEIDVSATIASFENDGYSASIPDEAEARAILREVANKCSTEGIELVPYFQDADRNNNGCLAFTVFSRVLDNRKLNLTEAQIQLLAKVYQSRHTSGQATTRPDVNYRAMCAVVDGYDDNAPIPDSNTFRKTTRTTTSTLSSSVVRKRTAKARAVDVDDVLLNMRMFIARNRKRPKEFLAESDVLNHGTITTAKFRTALAQLELSLEEAEISALIAAFQDDRMPDKVNYRKLVDQLDGQPRLEEQPDGAPRMVTQSIFRNQISDEQRLEEILNRVASVVAQKRIHLKPVFGDYDRNKSRTVKKWNFFKVLDNTQVKQAAELSDNDLDLIAAKFEVLNSRGVGDGFCNYHEFVQRVDAKTETS